MKKGVLDFINYVLKTAVVLFVTLSFNSCSVTSSVDFNGKNLVIDELKGLQAPMVFGLKSDTSKIEDGKDNSTIYKELTDDIRYDNMF